MIAMVIQDDRIERRLGAFMFVVTYGGGKQEIPANRALCTSPLKSAKLFPRTNHKFRCMKDSTIVCAE